MVGKAGINNNSSWLLQIFFTIDSQRLAWKVHNNANDRSTFEKVAPPGSVSLHGSGLDTTAIKHSFAP
jgi:hypothetical protein